MFNNDNRSSCTVNIKPACNGTLQKSHPESYFKWFHINSSYREKYIDGNSRVLQMMVFGDNNVLAEILPQEAYDRWLEESKEDRHGEE